eukprot:scaffold1105_cov140-Isochrysis_galbana.AAC.4
MGKAHHLAPGAQCVRQSCPSVLSLLPALALFGLCALRLWGLQPPGAFCLILGLLVKTSLDEER